MGNILMWHTNNESKECQKTEPASNLHWSILINITVTDFKEWMYCCLLQNIINFYWLETLSKWSVCLCAFLLGACVRYPLPIFFVFYSAVHMEGAAVLRGAAVGLEQQWPTVSSATAGKALTKTLHLYHSDKEEAITKTWSDLNYYTARITDQTGNHAKEIETQE